MIVTLPGRARRRLLTTVIVVTALLFVPPIAGAAPPLHRADPASPIAPSNPNDAKQAWLDAGRNYAALGEQVLVSQQQLSQAEQAYGAALQVVASRQAAYDVAKAVVDRAQQELDTAETAVRSAEKSVMATRAQLDEIANASVRNATSSALVSLLSAQNPEEYIGRSTVQQLVADDVTGTLVQARKERDEANSLRLVAEDKRTAALRAGADAIGAHQAAEQAVAQAQTAKAQAHTAKAQLEAQQQQLADQMEVYQRTYALLTDADRAAAITAQEAFNQASNAADTASRARRSGESIAAAQMSMADLAAAASRIAPSVAAGIAVTAAISRVGLPYVWGANGPNAFDCSSLMQWSWAQAGVTIPRTSAAQAGLRPIELSQLQPGDLVTYYRPVTHVGMYVGFGLVVHASQAGVPVKVVPLDKAGPKPWGHAVNR